LHLTDTKHHFVLFVDDSGFVIVDAANQRALSVETTCVGAGLPLFSLPLCGARHMDKRHLDTQTP